MTDPNEKREQELVLIVDDQPTNLQVLGELVESAGLNSALAMSGQEAMEFLEKEEPELILLDIMMPEMDGYQFLKTIRANPRHSDIPVIFISAKNKDEEETYGFELGCADYIGKPFKLSIVRARIQNQIELIRFRKGQKLHIQEIEIAKEELDRANKEKDLLFSIIAHDLKNPFSVILGLTKLILQMGDGLSLPKVMELIERIHDAGNRVYALLENLLEWANMQLGLVHYKPESVPVLQIVEECAGLLYESAMQKNISIRNEAKEWEVLADRNMLTTVIRNLVNNGIKFSNPGGQIRIQTNRVKDHIEIIVSDNGVGMKEETLKELYSSVGRVSSNGTLGEKGTGLGLRLCKELMEKNNGTLEISSIYGQGTTAKIRIPVTKGA